MTTPLERLKFIFKDKPEVQELLDPRYMESDQLEGSELMKFYREKEIFSKVVNMYVTGRTSVGKTSLGNQLSGDSLLMESTGHINCTDSVNTVQLKSNLRYFDLPGAGSDESYDNVNRAALSLKQTNDSPISKFKIRNFTNYKESGKPEEHIVDVTNWQNGNQQYKPDVYLYICAPHGGINNGDKKYILDLLNYNKDVHKTNKCVFALNLYTTPAGAPMYTEENVLDVEDAIKELYGHVFTEAQAPSIVRINSLTGLNFNKLAELISKVLPIESLTTFETDIRPELKKTVEDIKHARFIRLLINIASRIAVYKADEKLLQNSLFYEAYISVYIYGINIFYNKKIAEETIYENAKHLTEQGINEKKVNITRTEYVTEIEAITRTQSVPDFREVKKTEMVPIVRTVSRERAHTPIAGLGIRDAFFGKVKYETQEIDYQARTITTTEFVGIKEEVITIGEITKVIGKEDKIVGEKYLAGGYDFIEGLFSIGLGIEKSLKTNQEPTDFLMAYELGRIEAKERLSKVKPSIIEIIETNSIAEAESKLVSILSQVF